MNPIVVKTYPVEESKSNIFRLQPDAGEIMRQHQRASGLPAEYILSEIVRQTRDEVRFEMMHTDTGKRSVIEMPVINNYRRCTRHMPLADAQREEPVCRCARCMGEVYREECTYLFDGEEICSDCLKTEVYRLLEHNMNLLAELMGADVVRHV